MKITYQHTDLKDVTLRPMKARAMQLVYRENTEETMRHVQRIAACLDVTLECAGDQGGLFIHLKIDEYHSPIVSHEDWIVKDSFGKISILKDNEFRVYYEPE